MRSTRPGVLPTTGSRLPVGQVVAFGLALLFAGVLGQAGSMYVARPYVGKHRSAR